MPIVVTSNILEPMWNHLIYYAHCGTISSEILNNEYIERMHQMSYSSLSDNGMLQIFSFLIKLLYGNL